MAGFQVNIPICHLFVNLRQLFHFPCSLFSHIGTTLLVIQRHAFSFDSKIKQANQNCHFRLITSKSMMSIFFLSQTEIDSVFQAHTNIEISMDLFYIIQENPRRQQKTRKQNPKYGRTLSPMHKSVASNFRVIYYYQLIKNKIQTFPTRFTNTVG